MYPTQRADERGLRFGQISWSGPKNGWEDNQILHDKILEVFWINGGNIKAFKIANLIETGLSI